MLLLEIEMFKPSYCFSVLMKIYYLAMVYSALTISAFVRMRHTRAIVHPALLTTFTGQCRCVCRDVSKHDFGCSRPHKYTLLQNRTIPPTLSAGEAPCAIKANQRALGCSSSEFLSSQLPYSTRNRKEKQSFNRLLQQIGSLKAQKQ